MAIPRKPGPSVQSPAASADLLQILMFRKVLTREQAERVRRFARANSVAVVPAMVEMKLASEVQVAEALAAFTGLRFVKINPLELDLDVVTGALSAAFARRHGLVAIAKTSTTLTVAVHDPLGPFPADDLKNVSGLEIERVVATRTDVDAVTKNFYDLRTSLKTAEKQLAARRLPSFDLGNQEYLSAQADEMDPAAAPVVKALDHLLNYAFEQRASDIHFEPKRTATLVRLRIDGMLHDVHVIPRIVYQAIISRIKLLSGCNLAEKRRPQDGRIKREQGGREIELRVSTMPTAFGEKAVLRIFDPDILLTRIDRLGFSPADLEVFERFLGHTHGIILVTGPTGSGKTTTLYSVLKHLSRPEVNIVTIEDPIEMVHEDLNQVAVRPAIDLTFANALRTVLRQDPDIIMVGEIRDYETAEIAVKAALTGHLVLSTLHTNDAPSTVTRLLNMGIEPFLVSSSLNLIVAQRLARRVCQKCKEEIKILPKALADAGMKPERIRLAKPAKGKGCDECNGTGFRGRVALYEVMPIREEIKDLVLRGGSALDLQREAIRLGMKTLRQSGLTKLEEGVTTLEEVLRVTAPD